MRLLISAVITLLISASAFAFDVTSSENESMKTKADELCGCSGAYQAFSDLKRSSGAPAGAKQLSEMANGYGFVASVLIYRLNDNYELAGLYVEECKGRAHNYWLARVDSGPKNELVDDFSKQLKKCLTNGQFVEDILNTFRDEAYGLD